MGGQPRRPARGRDQHGPPHHADRTLSTHGGGPPHGRHPDIPREGTYFDDTGVIRTVEHQLEQWVNAKRAKNYPEADRIRDELRIKAHVDAESVRPAHGPPRGGPWPGGDGPPHNKRQRQDGYY